MEEMLWIEDIVESTQYGGELEGGATSGGLKC
jgi:hypothetical protein